MFHKHMSSSVQGHLMILVNHCVLSLLSFILMITDIILCMFIDLDQISSTATFLCDPDLDLFQGHLIIWLTFAFKFAFIHINDGRHCTLHVYRP